MIVADHLVPEKFRDPRQGVTEDGAANVPDVHRLGDVGRTEVDHDPATCVGERHAQPIVLQKPRGLQRDGLGLERKIDETGAGDRR